MKMLITQISCVNIQGTSKAGRPYHIDRTQITVAVPVNTDQAFGLKTTEYDYGDSTQFNTLTALRDRLPLECNIELGVEVDSYGNPKTVIKSLDVAKSSPKEQGAISNKGA